MPCATFEAWTGDERHADEGGQRTKALLQKYLVVERLNGSKFLCSALSKQALSKRASPQAASHMAEKNRAKGQVAAPRNSRAQT